MMCLADFTPGSRGVVVAVADDHAGDPIARRLRDLGFVAGEPIRLVTRGLLGGEPLLVQIGHTRFALRLNEARRVRVAGPTAA